MKKSIILFVFAMLSIAAFSQVTLKQNKYFLTHTGIVTDTVSSTSTTWNYPIFVNKGFGYFYSNAVKLSELTADFKCTVKLQGKYRLSDSYSDITSVIYSGGGTDTTILFTNTSTKTNYNYLNYLVTRTSGKGKVTYCDFNIKKY